MISFRCKLRQAAPKSRTYPALLVTLAWLVSIPVFAASNDAQAGKLFRYTDQNGQPVISNTLTDEGVKRGYDILNSSGRVIETVPRPPTEAEIAAREAAEAAKKLDAERQLQQKLDDERLLRVYSSPDDAVRGLKRKLQELHSLAKLKQSNITIQETQLEQEQEKAANVERSGHEVPEDILARIQKIRNQIQSLTEQLASQRANIKDVHEDFVEKIRRIETLTGKQRSLPVPDPNEG